MNFHGSTSEALSGLGGGEPDSGEFWLGEDAPRRHRACLSEAGQEHVTYR